jgi:hypothetical protein
VSSGRLFRTDRGDDEPGQFEWKGQMVTVGCVDKTGDDVVIRQNGKVEVAYRSQDGGC